MPISMDLATLGLEIRSDGVKTAAQRLQEMSSAAYIAATAADGLSKQAGAADKSASGLAASLKSAGVAMVGLASGYAALSAASAFMTQGMQYASSIEESRIGIATLITSMTKLSDAQGNVLTGMDKYVAAQTLAADMMSEIQRLGLETTATTKSLVEGAQTIMGPALQAGMALKDIPKFAVQGAQALQTLGVPLQQMRTELEALLTGNVNKSQDVLAPKLFSDVNGELGDYIRGLKQSGTLVEELKRRLQPFALAGADVAQTWTGLVSNLADAMDIVASASASDFTASMKQTVSTLLSMLTSTQEGAVGINENFQGIVDVLRIIEGQVGSNILSATKAVASVVERLGAHISEVGADKFLSDLATGAKVATAAFVSLLAARKAASVTFTVSGTAGEAQQVTGLRQYIALQYESVKAAQMRARQELEAALAQRQAAAAALTKFNAENQTAVAVRNVTQAEILRAAQQKQSVALENALTAAEARYAAALKATTVASQAQAAAAQAAGAARSALGGIVSALGGPVGIAVTGLTVGLTALALRTDETAEATNALSKAEQSYASAIQVAASGTGQLNQQLTQAQKLKLQLAQNDLEQAITRQVDSIRAKLGSLFTQETFSGDEIFGAGAFKTLIPEEFLTSAQKATEALQKGSLSANQFADEVAKIRQAAVDAGYGNTDFVKTLDDLSRQDGAVSLVVSLNEKLAKVRGVATDAAGGVTALTNATSALATKLEEALGGAKLEAYVSGLSKQQQALAKGLASDLGLKDLSSIQDALSGKGVKGLDSGKLKEYLNLQNQIYANSQRQSKSGGGGGSRSVEAGVEGLRKLKDEIDQLNGVSQKSTASLNQKVSDIAKLGKEAGLSSKQVSDLGRQYQEAFKKNALEEFNKELFKASNNTAELRKIEIAETMAQWSDRFKAAGMAAEEAAPKLAKLQSALETKTSYENLQVAADFYKELAQLSGNYGQSIAYQNQLLDQQAKLWLGIGIPASDVAERVRLMAQETSENPFDGFIRGARKFGNEYGDLAKQVESLTVNMGQTISNTLADAFMKGEFSAQKFFSSLISMAAQAMANYAIGSIFKGIGGLFGGGTAAGTGAHSGWTVGSGPGTFQRSVPLASYIAAPRFHGGGGFFGPDEYPAILKTGERVLNEEETRAYQGQVQATTSRVSFAPQIRVNITNTAGSQMDAEAESKDDGQGNLDLNIILREVDKGMTGLAKSGRSSFAKMMEKSYGLDRAKSLQRNRA